MSVSFGLTGRQQAVLDFLRDRIASTDIAPSYDEICAAFGYRSKSSVIRIFHSLKQRGLIDWIPGGARSLRLIDQPVLPAAVERRLSEFCQARGERRVDVIADAVIVFIDECERDELEARAIA